MDNVDDFYLFIRTSLEYNKINSLVLCFKEAD